MAQNGQDDSGILRAKLEFPVWYRGFTKSYSAWSNAPSDLKTPMLLSGAALAKAENWLLACPERLTDSQKRYIVRSITQKARGPLVSNAAPIAQRGPSRSHWHRTSDRSLWHLCAIALVGIWIFSPDFISDAIERSMNPPEVLEAVRRQKMADLQQAPNQQPRIEVVDAGEPAADAPRQAREAGDRAAADAPETEREPLLPELPAKAPEPPPPTPVERLANLSRERLAAADSRQALVLAIEAAELGRETPAENAADASLGSTLIAALATRGRLAPLATSTALTRAAIVCHDGRTTVIAGAQGRVTAWFADAGRHRAGPSLGARLQNAAVDRDCRRIASANEDFNVEIRALGGEGHPVVLAGHEAQIVGIGFSRDGSAVVTASQDSTARIFDARTGRQRAVLSGHDWHVNAAEFSPDGKRVLTAAADKTARIWDAGTGRELFVLDDHQGNVASARFTGDGRLVVTTSWDGFVRVFDASTGERLARVAHAEGSLTRAAVNRRGERLATIDQNGATQLWSLADAASPRVIASMPGKARDVVFSADDNWFIVHDWSGTVDLYAAASGQRVMRVGGGDDRIHAIAFAPASNGLTAITEAGMRATWPVMTSLQDMLLHAKSIAPACLTADERTLIGLDPEGPAWCSEIKARGAALPLQ